MKVLFHVLLVLTLAVSFQDAWAKKKKKKAKKQDAPAREVEVFPCLADWHGTVNPDFMESFRQISNKLSTCDESMDPRWKASLYVTHMKNLMDDMPDIVGDAAGDFFDDKVIDELKLIDERLIEAESPAMEWVENLAKGPLMLPQLEAAKNVFELMTVGMKLQKLSADKDKSKRKYESVSRGALGMRAFRDELKGNFKIMRARLDAIELALKTRTEDALTELSPENRELYRNIVCRFTPAMPKRLSDLDKDNEHYLKFCSTDGGKGNFNRERGSLACSDVEAINDENRPQEWKKLTSVFARELAENVPAADPHGFMPNGGPSRIEIKITDYNGEDRKISAEFVSVGGKTMICKMLDHPGYQKYFVMKNGRRVLGTGMPMKELRLPMVFNYHEGHPKYSDKDVFLMSKEEELEMIKINDHNPRDARGEGYKKYKKELRTLATSTPVRTLVGDTCDEK